ncbi:unnamed protein product [Cylindrotheca closterium]|uniref:STAS domain-containing protein n=1 Tax=Cylindrotheca closterium TaxID=2856 RepID=A0AAD2CM91_9STRA|nr:unnamed protein product [Cylindrotheca closterium]
MYNDKDQNKRQEEQNGESSSASSSLQNHQHNTAPSNLTSLFDPPSPSATRKGKKDEDNNGTAAGSSLQSMFAPPPGTTTTDVIFTSEALRTSPPSSSTKSIYSERTDAYAKTPPVSHLKPTLFQEPPIGHHHHHHQNDKTPVSSGSQLNSVILPPLVLPDTTPSSPTSQLSSLFETPVKTNKPVKVEPIASSTTISPLNSLFQPPLPSAKQKGGPRRILNNETTALLSGRDHDSNGYYKSNSRIDEGEEEDEITQSSARDDDPALLLATTSKRKRRIPDCGLGHPPTYAGAVMFLLYHVVFCLAQGSAIIRPHSSRPVLGIMAKMSTLGILVSGPFYILRLGLDIPALYPSVDLFLAPFMAKAAASIDESLAGRYPDGEDYPEEAFFGSFCVLVGIGMFLSGLFLHLGATVKLANLGAFLPYSVLCGFFSAVGVLLWALAFTVDTSGKNWKQVFFSGDSQLILESLIHHAPSLFMGIVMNILGPKNPFFVLLLLFVTWGLFYLVMFLTNTSLTQAQEAEWFWSKEQLVVDHDAIPFRVQPLCGVFAIFNLDDATVDWKAVWDGLDNMVALAFLYLLRSSIHASALKKNVANLVRRVPQKKEEVRGQNPQEDSEAEDDGSAITSKMLHSTVRTGTMLDSVRQTVQQVQWSLADDAKEIPNAVLSTHGPVELDPAIFEREDTATYTEVRAKPTKRTLEEIFVEYGYVLYIVALFGGFGCCPTISTSKTMYAIRADGLAPQLGSILLLLVFFLTDFDVVQYIPKAAFSSLLVLGAVDTLAVWFFDSFTKTLDVTEWLVVPSIVAFSLVIGFLNAVLVGVAISTFVFVGAFFRVGIVKFQATGKEIRSRIERSMEQCIVLNEHGDEMQFLVLQNYLFFGNAAKLCHYIFTMFEDVEMELEESNTDITVPPIPKVLLLDFSLTTGLDTSTVDIFNDIKEKCEENDCKLFLCGLTTRMRKALALGGIKPQAHLSRKMQTVRLFPDMDTGLGKAEDFLISLNAPTVRPGRTSPEISSGLSTKGFQTCLEKIDELHCQNFAESLVNLEPFVEPLELSPGAVLFESDGGVIRDEERGLFFIEVGTLKISRDSSMSLTLNRTRSYGHLGSVGAGSGSTGTISKRHARLQSLARSIGKSRLNADGTSSENFRLARIGPGWVIGTLENASGTQSPGIFTAMTRCRLYHLPFTTLQEIEKTNPLLVLQLYKMLSHLMAKKEEITSEHLSTLHTIMSSHANPKHLSSRMSSSSLSRGPG